MPIKRLRERFSKAHLWILLVLWAVFAAATLVTVHQGLDAGSGHWSRVLLTTAATMLGPLTGAVARHWQSCCLAFSLKLLPWSGGVLVVAAVVQVFWLPLGRFGRGVRLLIWALGLFVWFAGGIVSFGHALS